jgi:hypothetical protein
MNPNPRLILSTIWSGYSFCRSLTPLSRNSPTPRSHRRSTSADGEIANRIMPGRGADPSAAPSRYNNFPAVRRRVVADAQATF